MIYKIDEDKIKSELIFNNNGLRVLRYPKPFFVQIDGDGDIRTITAGRVVRDYCTKHIYKSPWFYRFIFQKDTIKQINEACLSIKELDYHEDYINQSRWRTITCGLSKDEYGILFEQIGKITGFQCNYKPVKHVEFEYSQDTIDYTTESDVIMFNPDDLTELFGMCKKEKEIEEKRNDEQLFDTLFKNNITTVVNKYKLEYNGNCGCMYFNNDTMKYIITNYIQEVSQNIISDLKQMGIECKINPKFSDELDDVIWKLCYPHILSVKKSVKGIVK